MALMLSRLEGLSKSIPEYLQLLVPLLHAY